MGGTDDKEAPSSGSVAHDDAKSESSCYATEDEEDTQIHLGPKISIKEHLEKDKVFTFYFLILNKLFLF